LGQNGWRCGDSGRNPFFLWTAKGTEFRIAVSISVSAARFERAPSIPGPIRRFGIALDSIRIPLAAFEWLFFFIGILTAQTEGGLI